MTVSKREVSIRVGGVNSLEEMVLNYESGCSIGSDMSDRNVSVRTVGVYVRLF